MCRARAAFFERPGEGRFARWVRRGRLSAPSNAKVICRAPDAPLFSWPIPSANFSRPPISERRGRSRPIPVNYGCSILAQARTHASYRAPVFTPVDNSLLGDQAAGADPQKQKKYHDHQNSSFPALVKAVQFNLDKPVHSPTPGLYAASPVTGLCLHSNTVRQPPPSKKARSYARRIAICLYRYELGVGVCFSCLFHVNAIRIVQRSAPVYFLPCGVLRLW
jgi:hypothetical protein